jgi:hypothetical protein
MKIRRRLWLIDLSQLRPVKSPFFEDLLRWRLDLANLLYRLGQDMARPVMPHEQEILYKPTQLLALMIQATGHDGCIYPSAMGSGKNYVLFDTQAAEVLNIEHVRVTSATFFSKPLSPYEGRGSDAAAARGNGAEVQGGVRHRLRRRAARLGSGRAGGGTLSRIYNW